MTYINWYLTVVPNFSVAVSDYSIWSCWLSRSWHHCADTCRCPHLLCFVVMLNGLGLQLLLCSTVLLSYSVSAENRTWRNTQIIWTYYDSAILNHHINQHQLFWDFCRYRWPSDLRRGSAADRLLIWWVRIPPGACMCVRMCVASVCVVW